MFRLNLIIQNITPGGLFSRGEGGGLYIEGVFRFKSWFLNAPGLIHGEAYYQNFTVFYIYLTVIGFNTSMLKVNCKQSLQVMILLTRAAMLRNAKQRRAWP